MTPAFPLRSTLALALALASAPSLAGEYSRTVFFGDSLTDTGHFRPQIPEQARPFTGKFTTNPDWVWAEYVAKRFGGDARTDGEGGDNYAQGGSRAGVASGTADSTLSQVQAYLGANGGKADPNALYTVWTGANDLFAVASGAPAQATVAESVGAVVQAVGTLQAAGARYILVPSLPDMGLTPQALAGGQVAQATMSQLSGGYNTAMYGALAQAGYRVIPLDTYNMLREVVASPSTYGLTNVTGTACQPAGSSSLTCTPASYISPDAASTYLFADGVHPSGAAHEVLGHYAISVLEGPRLAAVLPHASSVSGRARADQVAGHVQERPQAAGLRWWGGLGVEHQRYSHGDLYEGVAPAGLVGLDWSNGQGLVAGGYLGHGRMDADFGHDAGGFKQNESTLGGFLGWYGQRAWVNAQASYTRIDADIDREVRMGQALRVHSGSADGDNLALGLAAGYRFGDGAFHHGPVASLLWQQVSLDGWKEGNLSSSALAYPDQELDSLLGSIGWEASYQAGALLPYVRATWDHEFKDPAAQAFARLQTLDVEYAVPGLGTDTDYGTVVLGARFGLFGLQADLGLRGSVERTGAADRALFMSLGGKF